MKVRRVYTWSVFLGENRMQPQVSPFEKYELRILQLIRERITKRSDSLANLQEFGQDLGIEGWLKVEAIQALKNDFLIRVKNEGPDLVLTTDDSQTVKKVELKADTANYFVSDEIAKKFPSADIIVYLKRQTRRELEGYDIERDSIGTNGWELGMLKPKSLIHQKVATQAE